MINLISIDKKLGDSAGKIICNNSISRFATEQNKSYKVLLLEKGSAKITFKDCNVLLQEKQILFIDNETSFIIGSMENFSMSYIQFTEEHFYSNHELNLLIEYSNLFKNKKFNKFTLNEKYFSIIEHNLNLLTTLQAKEKTTLNSLFIQNTLHQIILSAISISSENDENLMLYKKEDINKKELDRIAIEEANKISLLNPKEGKNVAFYKGYKAGYRKAKEE